MTPAVQYCRETFIRQKSNNACNVRLKFADAYTLPCSTEGESKFIIRGIIRSSLPSGFTYIQIPN